MESHSPDRVGTSALGSRGRPCAPRPARIASDAEVRVACKARPVWAAALRALGGLLILVALLAPGLASAWSAQPVVQPSAPPTEPEIVEDDGACGEEQETYYEELVDCGAELDAKLDEPLAIALLRTTEVRMTSQQCEELLADIWSRQSCTIAGRECGKLFAGGVAAPGLELVSSSASGHVSALADGMDPAQVRRLARPLDQRMPKLPDLSPPVPPPKLVLR